MRPRHPRLPKQRLSIGTAPIEHAARLLAQVDHELECAVRQHMFASVRRIHILEEPKPIDVTRERFLGNVLAEDHPPRSFPERCHFTTRKFTRLGCENLQAAGYEWRVVKARKNGLIRGPNSPLRGRAGIARACAPLDVLAHRRDVAMDSHERNRRGECNSSPRLLIPMECRESNTNCHTSLRELSRIIRK